MARVTTTVNVSVSDGQNVIAPSSPVEAEAVDRIDIDLLPDDTQVNIEIQPSGSGQLHTLLISSDFYGPELSYLFSDGTTDSAVTLVLDAPHLYSSGNIAAVGVDPLIMRVTMSAAGSAANLAVFVARHATPPPP